MLSVSFHRDLAEISTLPDAGAAVFMTEDLQDGFAGLAARIPAVPLYGAIVPNLIRDREIIDSGVAVLALDPSGFAFVCDLHASSGEILSSMTADVASLLLFVDGLSPAMDQFVAALDTCTESLPVLGTGVGCRDFAPRPVIADRRGFGSDRALVIGTRMNLQAGARHGWRTLHGPLVVTRARDNVIHELNGQPAFTVYRDILRSIEGVDITREDFFSVAKSYPFGLSTFQGGEVIVRDPFMANEDGSLTIVSSVQELSTLYVMKGDHTALIESTGSLSRETFASSSGRQAILFDCISRVLFLESDFQLEIDGVVANSRRADLTVFGITSIGEITNIGHDEIKILNKTTLLGVLEDE